MGTSELLIRPWCSPRVGRWALRVWVVVQVALLVTAWTTDHWPWRMFVSSPGPARTLRVDARVDGGTWQRLPVEEVFGYTRGFTNRTIPHEARALRTTRTSPRRKRERERFARWMVEYTAPDAGYDEVRLQWVVHRNRGDEYKPLGTWSLR